MNRTLIVQLDYYLIRLLSGHGYLESYLHTIEKSHSPDFIHCEDMLDDAYHTFSFYRRWNGHRHRPSMEGRQVFPGSWSRARTGGVVNGLESDSVAFI